ncbi:MAG: type III-B CRISPR module RAMP protein Cmr1 [Thermodesulfobacteria bacterium]|nr:type III-B CRISPR module RAMP protein Cmr1 [Thermodesulfobacteriota bacterium]
MRSLDKCPEVKVDEFSPTRILPLDSVEFKLEFLTPLYGGGVIAGEVDEVTPVRAPSIRGQLRFWWRATRGAAFDNVTALKNREDEVWGSTDKPSPVEVVVEGPEKIEYRKKDDHGGPFGFEKYGPESYALFPALNDDDAGDLAKEGLTFNVNISWPSDRNIDKDIRAAIWAWVNFGGLGARTRRGLGSLWCKDQPERYHADDLDAFEQWFNDAVSQFELDHLGTPRPWPVLPRAFLYLKKCGGSALDAWHEGLSVLKLFRQGKNIGRDPGRENRPGRSRWPEAESIREIAVEQLGKNRKELRLKSKDNRPIPTPYFPRAEFGLPIIFEIRNEGLKPTLLPPSTNGERMASPVVIRPLRFVNESHATLIFFLATHPLNQARLKPSNKDKLKKEVQIDASHIRNPELTSYKNSPLAGTSTGSALEGFRNFIKTRGFKEVKP